MRNYSGQANTVVITWRLFTGFFRIGAFTVGGGYAMLPLIQHYIVEKKHWVDKNEFLDLIALAQSFPGVIAINTAAVIGYRINGLSGALAAMLGAGLPSFMIILLLVNYFFRFRNNIYVSHFLAGARAGVVGLLVYAACSLGTRILRNMRAWFIFGIGVLLLVFLHVHPATAVITSAILGYLLFAGREGS
ncbi:MAG: chromate transporter [Thermoanaerobacteraceae bacterium]|nr:chromate transporter [Thermoanaerobacteraceae bacterium]